MYFLSVVLALTLFGLAVMTDYALDNTNLLPSFKQVLFISILCWIPVINALVIITGCYLVKEQLKTNSQPIQHS